jgi:hypothetical protein
MRINTKVMFCIVYKIDKDAGIDKILYKSYSFISCLKRWRRSSHYSVKTGYRIVIMENDMYMGDVHLRAWMFKSIV